VGRAYTEGRTEVYMGVGPHCAGDPKICAHGCMPVIWISAHGCACRGDKGVHGMRAYFLHSCTWVRDYVVERRAVMHACVHDRGAWRCLYMADRHALMLACGMNRHACVCAYGVNRCTNVCACGVNRHAYVRAYGLNNSALEERLMGKKLIFFGDFNVFYGRHG
jgi:hypothetical protein